MSILREILKNYRVSPFLAVVVVAALFNMVREPHFRSNFCFEGSLFGEIYQLDEGAIYSTVPEEVLEIESLVSSTHLIKREELYRWNSSLVFNPYKEEKGMALYKEPKYYYIYSLQEIII